MAGPSRSFWKVTLLASCLVVTAALSGVVVGWFSHVATQVTANLEYTMQVAELADLVAERLESGDDPKQVAADLRQFREFYVPTYEGLPFRELVDKYLRDDEDKGATE